MALFALHVPDLARAQGLVREPENNYQSFPVTVRFRSYLPPEVDLSSAFPTPGAQGGQASCTAWAVGYGLRSYYEHIRQGWDLSDRHHLFSPAFVYNQLAGGADCSRGSSISQALILLQQQGDVSLADFPYDATQCRTAPSASLLASAQHFRIDGWQRVDASNLDDVKGELHRGNPVVIGMDVSASFERLKAGEIYDDIAAPRTFSHAMVTVGYSESRQAFKVMNSWGTNWADGGFGWISYRALQQLADRAFVVRVAGATPAVQISSLGQSPPPPPPAAQPAPSTTPPAIVPAAAPVTPLDQLLSGFQCAKLTLGEAGAKRLSGFVATEIDRQRLRQDLASRADDSSVVVRPWPECEALVTFDPELHSSHGLEVSVLAPNGLLHEGGRLVVEVTSPDFPSYLYVTYLQASGDAVHLRQPAPLGRALPPHTRLRIGADEPGQSEIRIAPPFGQEMVIAMATASPLFAEDRPTTEIERDYLTAYRAALLARSAGGNVRRLTAAAVAILTTAPR